MHPVHSLEPAYLRPDTSTHPGSVIMMKNRSSSHADSSDNNSSSGRLSMSIRVVRSAPSLLTLDDYNLISLGYKPVLSRRLSWITLLGIMVTASNVLCGIVALYGLPLTNGGPAWATWSYVAVGSMSIVVSLCIAELASAYPTAAGIHHWVYRLGSTHQRAYLTWLTGWLTIASSIASASSVAFYFSSILGQILLSIYRVSSTPGMLVMFHLGAVLFWQAFNLLPIRGLGYISTMGGLFVIGVVVALTTLLVMSSPIDVSFINIPFSTYLNYSGSSSALYAGLSSALMASFVFCPQDTVIRMSEECRRPEHTIPHIITWTNFFSLILGLPLVIALNFGILQPMKGLLDEPVPAVRVILVTLGKAPGSVSISLVLAAVFFTGLSRLGIATRVAFSFARDGGIPKSSYWTHLHPRRRTPQRISWLVTAACMSAIFPFYWGDNNAFHWITSLACVSTNLSFVIPLWMRLTKEGQLRHDPGPFSLGSFSRLLNTIAILWLLFLSCILMLPSTLPLTRSNFNYTPAAIAGIFIMSSMCWCKAKYDFNGRAKEGSRAVHRSLSPFRDSHIRSQPQGPPYHHHQESGYHLQDTRHLSYSRSQQPQNNVLESYPQTATQHRPRLTRSLSHSRQPGHTRRTLSSQPQSRSKNELLGGSSNDVLAMATTTSETRRATDGAGLPGAAGHYGKQLFQQSRNSNDSYRQSQPSAALGTPLCDYPEPLPPLVTSPSSDPHEPRKISTPETQQKVYTTDGPPDYRDEDSNPVESNDAGSQDHEADGYPDHSLAASAAVPEISIAPPTTISSQESERSRATTTATTDSATTEAPSGRVDSMPIVIASFPSSSLPCSVVQTEASVQTESLSRHFPISPVIRPPNATESIFGDGVGMKQQVKSTMTDTIALGLSSGTGSQPKVTIGPQIHPLDFPDRRPSDKSTRKRPPTPYPPNKDNPGHDTSSSNPSASPLLTPKVMATSTMEHSSDSDDAVWTARIREVDRDQGAPKLKTGEPARPVHHLLRRPAQYPMQSSAKLSSHDVHALAAAVAVEDIMDVDEAYEAEHHHQYPVISRYQSSHDLFNLPPPATTPLATIKSNTMAGVAMDVDEAFEKENYYQRSVISTYQPSHDLFNLPASALAAAAEEAKKGTTMRPSGLKRESQMISQDENDDDKAKSPCSEPVEDQDDKVSSLNLVKGEIVSGGGTSFPPRLQGATLDARRGELDERKARDESVARWAEEQGKILERRLRKQKMNQVRTLALQDLRRDQYVYRSTLGTAGKDGLLSVAPLKVRLEQDRSDDSDNINVQQEDAVLDGDGGRDGDEVLLLERVETLGAGVGKP